MPLYQWNDQNTTHQIKPTSFSRERQLQHLFEKNLYELLGVHFIATEFMTGDRHKGRIDTLGIDQDGSPTIIEYKRSSKSNIINQGLFYLDWLVNHKGDFAIAAQKNLDGEIEIDWSHPRLILIAEKFSEYDKYAVNRIGANIELWIFHRYGDNLLYLDPIFSSNPLRKSKPRKTLPFEGVSTDEGLERIDKTETEVKIYTLEEHLNGKKKSIQELFLSLQEEIFSLSDDDTIIEKPNKMYMSYKHGKNFCEVRIQAAALKLWLDIPYEELHDPNQLGRDMAEIGHLGTGSVEVIFNDHAELDYVVTLIEQSYRQTL